MLFSSAVWAASSIAASFYLVSRAPEYTIAQSYTLTAIILFSTVTVIRIFYYVILYPRFFSPFRDLPSPKGNSLINGQLSALLSETQGDPLRRWMDEVPNNGIIRYQHLFNHERLYFTSPRAIADLHINKTYDFVKQDYLEHTFAKIIGVGILSAEGDEHRRQRKSLLPAFTHRQIKSLEPIFWSKAVEARDCLIEILDKDPYAIINIGQWLSNTALDIIGLAGVGIDFNAIKTPDNELSARYRSIFVVSDPIAKAIDYIAEFIDIRIFTALPLKRNKAHAESAQYIRNFCRHVVRQKAEKLEKSSFNADSNDICSVAFESGAFSEENMVDQMMTILAAGHETTGTSLQWALYLLCKNPEMQTRLREEIRTHMASNSHDTITSLPYLNAICQETLRFYPPLPITIRQAVRNTTIQDRFIPKGTVVITSPWASNRSKELWGADANEFKPDRWMGPGNATTGGATGNYSFLTFLHGPRSCIGMGFAKSEFLNVLAAWIEKFEFELEYPDQEVKIEDPITNGPQGGLRVRMKVLEGW